MSLTMINILISILMLIAFTREQTVPTAPCPGVFNYDSLGNEAGRWYGVVHLNTDTQLRGLLLDIELDSKANLLGNYIGDISSKDNINYKVENSQMVITPGSPVHVRIFVQYNVLKPAPKIKSIKFNGREICNADISRPSFGIPDFGSTEYTNAPSGTQDATSWTESSINPIEQSSKETTDIDMKVSQAQCGRVINENPLIIGGMKTLEGQWPWQVAIYETKVADSKFICGGTLVSRRNVITAAHCTTIQGSNHLKDKRTFILFLGKHNLQTTTYGVQIRYVDQILVHPEYNHINKKHDVSIITMLDRVDYTNRVKSACLWPENLIPLSSVIGKKGSVVGWGYDVNGVATEELYLVKMQVVSIETCLRSKNEVYNQLTSAFSYCAGNRDGSSVCNGDSGGGMTFQLEDGSWYIRGLVSQGVAKANVRICDPKHYVVFTDLAKYLSWIKKNIFD